MKRVQALVAAGLMTAVIAVCMVVVGATALFNPNGVKAQDGPVEAAVVSQPVAVPETGRSDAQVAQLQNELGQYKQQLDQANQQLDQANQQIEQANQQLTDAAQQLDQYQQVLNELQRRGLIRVTSDGQIQLRRVGGDDD